MKLIFVAENTAENAEKIETVINLFSDYELGFLTENELEAKLAELNWK